MQRPRGPGEVFLKAGTCFLECNPALMLPTQLPAQDILLVGLWLGGKGMAGASGQEPGEPSLGGAWMEGLPVQRTVPSLLHSMRGRSRGDGLRLYWKTQIKPKRGLCLGRGWNSESGLHMEAGCFKKCLFWGVRV